jgi:prefoldin subunit 5
VFAGDHEGRFTKRVLGVKPVSTNISVPVPENRPLPDRLAAAYKRLAASAAILNAASDEFTEPIAELDAALAKLNIGLITWEKIIAGEDNGGGFWSREVGYTRVKGTWGLAIRTLAGQYGWEEDASEETWLFRDAPRSYRIEAVEKLPDLLEGLIGNADKTSKKLKEKAVEARALAAALKQATDELKTQKKERR